MKRNSYGGLKGRIRITDTIVNRFTGSNHIGGKKVYLENVAQPPDAFQNNVLQALVKWCEQHEDVSPDAIPISALEGIRPLLGQAAMSSVMRAVKALAAAGTLTMDARSIGFA